jgi:integrase
VTIPPPTIIEENTTTAGRAYRNFVNSCRSTATRELYVKGLKYYIEFLDLVPGLDDDYYEKLLTLDVKITQQNICDFIDYCKKKKEVSSGTINAYAAAIRKFYDINEIELKWKKINSFKPEHETVVEDRPYTKEEIAKLVEHADYRDRAIILLLCSSGLRVGGIASLRLKDLEPIEKYDIYKVTIYKKSVRSRYFTFCTPEARSAIDSCIQWRKRLGERISKDSILFRKKFDTDDLGKAVNNVQPMTTPAIRRRIYDLLTQSGVRIPEKLTETSKKSNRTSIMQCHAFRKFFETEAFQAGMDEMYIRRLLGQKTGLEDSYLRLSEEDLLEGNDKHVGYSGIIDFLTIAEENRLRKHVETLTIERNKIEERIEKIAAACKKFGIEI